MTDRNGDLRLADGPPPEPGVRRGGLVLDQRADHFDRALAAREYLAAGECERGILGVAAGERQKPRLRQTVDDTPGTPAQ